MAHLLLEQLCQFYVEMNLIPPDYSRKTNDPLRRNCSKGSECWKNIDLSDNGYGMIRPWIGKHYLESRTLVLGINMNDCGGLYALENLIDNEDNAARKALKAGQYKHFIDHEHNYNGTIFYYRLAHLGAVVEHLVKGTNPEALHGEASAVADGFDWIAYTNHVKCSPKGNRSKPSGSMWQNCGKHILRQELSLLRPRYIVVFGTGDNFHYLCQSVLWDETSADFSQIGKIKLAAGDYNGASLKVIGMPHPAAPGAGDTAFHTAHEILSSIMLS
jgi:hypothetical protein